ncbi:MAG: hypothetical protein OEY27_06585 [Gammaproteobacteria bacterium]|nr:hypothetical protein [Gammaproteobacteria bacterium]
MDVVIAPLSVVVPAAFIETATMRDDGIGNKQHDNKHPKTLPEGF